MAASGVSRGGVRAPPSAQPSYFSARYMQPARVLGRLTFSILGDMRKLGKYVKKSSRSASRVRRRPGSPRRSEGVAKKYL